MLMAYEKGAALIVSVGAHFNLIEFLDRKRDGMSSTFLTRLRIGEKLVDAKGVSRLYNPGSTLGPLVLFLAAFAVLLVIVVVTSPALNDLVELLWLKIRIWLGAVARAATDASSLRPPMGYSARYHAASLIAVFLALAIGILIGAEFGGDTLNSTRKNLEQSLTGNLQDARARADQLGGELGRANEFAERVYPVAGARPARGRRIGLVALGDLPGDVTGDRGSAGADRGAPGRGRRRARAGRRPRPGRRPLEDPLRRHRRNPDTQTAFGGRHRAPDRPRRNPARKSCAASSSRGPAATSARSTG